MTRGREEEWTVVVRRRRRPPYGTGKTSTYVSNLPDSFWKGDLWKMLAMHGEVTDVFIAKKKDVNKKNFASVRFAKVYKESDLERKLQGLMFAGRPLTVNIARFDRSAPPQKKFNVDPRKPGNPISPRPGFRGTSSYKAVATGAEGFNPPKPPPHPPPPPPPISPPPIPMTCGALINNWLKDKLTLTGDARSLEHLTSLQPDKMDEGRLCY